MRPDMHLARPLIVSLLAAAACLAAGCVKATTGVPWSTKDQSIALESGLAPPVPSPPPAVETGTDGAMPVETAGDTTSLYQRCVALLREAATSEYGQLRANAIEALQGAPEHLEPVVARGLADDNRGVRFVAAMTIGTLRISELAHLLQPLLNDPSESVRAAALFGLDRCGRRVDLTPLATMLASDDPEVRGNAALILGELGNPTALPMLQQSMGRGMTRVVEARVRIVELQVAEAMVRLGDDAAIEGIRAALFTPAEQGEITAVACMACGRLHDERAVPNLARLALATEPYRQPAEVRMAATWALANIDPLQAPVSVPMEYVTDSLFQLRAQAASTLGRIGDPAALKTLAKMLDDESSLVRVAAAGAVLRVLEQTGSAPST